MRKVILVSLLGFLSGCAWSPIAKYHGMLDDKINSAHKEDIDMMLGMSTFCRPESTQGQAAVGVNGELCEYRTAAGRNYIIPDADRKNYAMGPDLSPYDMFDVLHLYYDQAGVLRQWQPYYLHQ